jgi:Glyoxalase/Bleomycin resistance protein/Dioxygenase superfamily
MVESEHYHVGIIVEEMEAARAHLEELLGVVWGPIMEYDADFRDKSGEPTIYPLRICYSTVAPYIELIEEVRGTIWECNEHSNLHHIGFWTEAVGDDGDRWTALGCPFVLGPWEDGEIRAAYHHDALGVRLELVSTSRRELIEEVMAAPPTL